MTKNNSKINIKKFCNFLLRVKVKPLEHQQELDETYHDQCLSVVTSFRQLGVEIAVLVLRLVVKRENNINIWLVWEVCENSTNKFCEYQNVFLNNFL